MVSQNSTALRFVLDLTLNGFEDAELQRSNTGEMGWRPDRTVAK